MVAFLHSDVVIPIVVTLTSTSKKGVLVGDVKICG